MSNTELLEKLGTLRGQVAQMTPGPWEWRWKGNELRSLSDRGEYTYGSLVACIRDDDDGLPMISEPNADGIAALRNVADELIAAVEAALPALEALREEVTKECVCSWCVTAQSALETADAALDRLAKKLEAR